jgi:hypothetical protein
MNNAYDILNYFLPTYIVMDIDNYIGQRKNSTIEWRNFKGRLFRSYDRPSMINYFSQLIPCVKYKWINRYKTIHETIISKYCQRNETYYDSHGRIEKNIMITPDGTIYKSYFNNNRFVKKEQLQPSTPEYLFYLNNFFLYK